MPLHHACVTARNAERQELQRFEHATLRTVVRRAIRWTTESHALCACEHGHVDTAYAIDNVNLDTPPSAVRNVVYLASWRCNARVMLRR